ncbi:hypothetical protein [Streptomyces sp. NPDC003032]
MKDHAGRGGSGAGARGARQLRCRRFHNAHVRPPEAERGRRAAVVARPQVAAGEARRGVNEGGHPRRRGARHDHRHHAATAYAQARDLAEQHGVAGERATSQAHRALVLAFTDPDAADDEIHLASDDYERLISHSEAHPTWTMITLMVHRLIGRETTVTGVKRLVVSGASYSPAGEKTSNRGTGS